VSNATRATRARPPERTRRNVYTRVRARMQRREPRVAARTAPTCISNVIRRPYGSSPCTHVHVDLSLSLARARTLRNTSPRRGSTDTTKNRLGRGNCVPRPLLAACGYVPSYMHHANATANTPHHVRARRGDQLETRKVSWHS